jgi:hypothetical protein
LKKEIEQLALFEGIKTEELDRILAYDHARVEEQWFSDGRRSIEHSTWDGDLYADASDVKGDRVLSQALHQTAQRDDHEPSRNRRRKPAALI